MMRSEVEGGSMLTPGQGGEGGGNKQQNPEKGTKQNQTNTGKRPIKRLGINGIVRQSRKPKENKNFW